MLGGVFQYRECLRCGVEFNDSGTVTGECFGPEQDFDRDSNVIEVFVGRLRKKLDPLNPIRTVRGQGYRFNTEGSA